MVASAKRKWPVRNAQSNPVDNLNPYKSFSYGCCLCSQTPPTQPDIAEERQPKQRLEQYLKE